jgi:hypothetical protein
MAKQEFSALVLECLGVNEKVIDKLQVELDVTVSEDAVKKAINHFAHWGNKDDVQMMIVRHIFQTVIDRYEARLDKNKFKMHLQFDDPDPHLEYDGKRIRYYQNLDNIIREQKEIEQWEAQKNAPREFHLTADDKKILLDWGNSEEDLDQIELEANVCEFTQCYKSKPDRKITRDEAIKILGRKQFLSGIDRAAFHWNCGRENGNRYVHFESGLVGRHVNEFVY